ncbi:MAG TPA: hypothetical protein PKW08_04645 [Flavobacteriaceae bacterium]|nr:hypothetical protein [Flavobacteriaceae bacterium]MCB9212512.1 hypothetical protein [Alteromonas sp.]HPF10575.1 hypothetical protein [Flavobacteriaceae bacterium]HQU20857.1 hypothetical protein [Flavobacteriaceae bacterium]HQU64341.1 hypothetical protein [Flavobacteriaceae bacterium]
MKFLLLLGCALLLLQQKSCNAPNAPHPAASHFKEQWQVALPNYLPQSIAFDVRDNGYFYVAAKEGGLLVYKEFPNGAQQVAQVTVPELGGQEAMHLYQQGHFVYLALGSFFKAGNQAGLAVVNVANPNQPVVATRWEVPNGVKGSAVVLVEGNYAYLGAMSDGLYILDVSNPNAITEKGHLVPDRNFPTPNPNAVQEPNARGMALKGNYLYLCNDAGGIRVIDISDKAHPLEKGKFINTAVQKQRAYNNILIQGHYAYVATDYCGMEVWDLTHPEQLTLVSWCNPWACDSPSNIWLNSGGHANQLAYDAQHQMVVLSTGGSELSLMDVSNPLECRYVGSYGSRNNGLGTWGLTLKDQKVYATYIKTVIPFKGTWSGIRCIVLTP